MWAADREGAGRQRRENEKFMKMMQDPRRQPDEKIAFLSKFYADKVVPDMKQEGQ